MPGAHQVAGEDALQIEAVKAARIGAVMGHRAAYQRLRQQQQRHDHKELHQRVLAPAGLSRQQVRVHMVAARDPAQVIEFPECQQHRRNAGQQHHQAQRAPQQRVGRGLITDARVIRKIVGIGIVLARTGGHRRPGRPSDKGGELAQLGRIGDEVGLQTAVARWMAEVVGPVVDLLAIGRRLRCSQTQRGGGRVVTIGFECHRRFGVHCCLLRTRQCGQGLLILLLRNGLGGDLAHAMQRLGRVIRPEISAVAPNAAIGHQAVLEKYRLAVADVVTAEQRDTLRVHHLRRDRRCIAVGQHRDRDQPSKAEHHHDHHAAYPPGRKRAVVFGHRLRSDTHDSLLFTIVSRPVAGQAATVPRKRGI